MEISVEVTADDVRAFQFYLGRTEPLYGKLRGERVFIFLDP